MKSIRIDLFGGTNPYSLPLPFYEREKLLYFTELLTTILNFYKPLKMKFSYLILSVSLTLAAFAVSAQQNLYTELADDIDIIVDASGNGDYTTVQAAINAVPNSSSRRTVIFIRNGSYYEKVIISSSKKTWLSLANMWIAPGFTMMIMRPYPDLIVPRSGSMPAISWL